MSRQPLELAEDVARVAAEEAPESDRSATFPVRTLAALRDTQLLGALVPTEHGGLGASFSDVVDVTMALGRVDMSVALVYAMHSQQALTLIHHAGSELSDEVLPSLAKGDLYLGSITTEPAASATLFEAQSKAGLAHGRVLIDRMAPVVTGGRHADAFLATMRSPGADSPSQVDLLYADRTALELEPRGDWNPLGMRATESGPMMVRGQVPVSNRVGEPGGFAEIAKATFIPAAHIGWAAAWLGAATGALSRVNRHLRAQARSGGGKPLPDLGLARLGSVRTDLDCVHGLLRHTVSVFESGQPRADASFQATVNSVKLVAAERCWRAVNELVELVGLRYGYLLDSELGLERTLRDLRSASLNFADDKLRLATGSLSLMDTGAHLA